MIVRYYPYTLTLEAPVVLTVPGGDPNSVESMSFIPGSAVRGSAARGLSGALPDQFHRLILSGAVCYLNAYFLSGARRCLPTPVSFRREKYSSSRYHDLAGYTGAEDWPSHQLVRVPAEFLALDGPEPQPATVSISGCMHHQQDRVMGRPTGEPGALFRYDALDLGQCFGGFIACRGPDKDVVERLVGEVRQALGRTLLLGRSRRAGYGGSARIEWREPQKREVVGQRVAAGSQPAGTVLRVLFTSDYIGRDAETGQLNPSAWVDELRMRLGGRIEEMVPPQRFGEFRLTGGFNRTWGTELPQVLALRAGSVLVVRVTETLTEEDLLAVEHDGLGERRTEGFGRLVFLDEPKQLWSLGSEARRESVPVPAGEPPPLIRQMEARLVADAVAERVQEVATDLARSAEPGRLPTRSLLGRLRVPLRLPPERALDELAAWLGLRPGREGLRSPARRQLERCRIRPNQASWQSLAHWLRELVEGGSDLTAMLRYHALAQGHHFISEDSALTWLSAPAQATQVRAGLIEALIAALSRRRDREERTERGVG